MCVFNVIIEEGIIMGFINWPKMLINILEYMTTFSNNGNFTVTYAHLFFQRKMTIENSPFCPQQIGHFTALLKLMYVVCIVSAPI